ncbi:hypothetical protein SBDP1_270038 [Syntrophobacter sp. SbD1]|nr:hypothetical protein SBDP1_270038 [Syntrophobacter sp. SbD1]
MVILSSPPTKDAAKITIRHAGREDFKFESLNSIYVWKRFKHGRGWAGSNTKSPVTDSDAIQRARYRTGQCMPP